MTAYLSVTSQKTTTYMYSVLRDLLIGTCLKSTENHALETGFQRWDLSETLFTKYMHFIHRALMYVVTGDHKQKNGVL